MLKTLVLTRFKGMFFRKPPEGKKQKNMTWLYIVLYAYLAITFGGMFMLNYITFFDNFVTALNTPELYFGLASVISMMLGFIGSVTMTQSQLYDAKDNELLLSMPIKPSTILASRLIVLYVWSFVFSAVNFVPAIIQYTRKATVTFAGAVAMGLELFLVPLFALTAAFVIAWIIKIATSRLKNKALVTTIFTLVFFAAYMIFCFRISDFSTIIVANSEAVSGAFSSYLKMFLICGKAVSTADFLNILLMILVTVGPFAVALYILSISFIKLTTTKVGGAKVKYKKEKMKVTSVRNAIAKKELRLFLGCPTYSVNALLGILMMLGVSVFFVIKSEALFGILQEIGDYVIPDEFMVAIIVLVVTYIGLIAETTACSISLEGNRLWILKSAPLKTIDILKGKLYAGFYVSLPISILTGIVLQFIGHMNPLERVLAFLLPSIVQVFSAYFGLAVNLRLPKLNWTSEVQAIKQSGAAFVVVFGGLGMMILLILLFFVCYTFLSGDLFMLIVAVLFTLGSVGYEIYLHNKGIKRFEEL